METSKRWAEVGRIAGKTEPKLSQVLFGLGRQDVKIRAEEQMIQSELLDGLPSQHLALQIIDHATVSYMWVMALYEVVRTLHQRLRAVSPDTAAKVAVAKREFERIRIPMAKLEAASRFPEDSPFAWPSMDRLKGMSWYLSGELMISRAELAELFLSTVESCDAAPPSPAGCI